MDLITDLKDERLNELKPYSIYDEISDLMSAAKVSSLLGDSLRAALTRLALLEKVVEAAVPFAEDGPRSFGDLVALRAALKSAGEGGK